MGNENKAGFSRKRVVKYEVGEGKRYRYTFKFYSRYNGKQLKSFEHESDITEYTIFSTSKRGTFSQKSPEKAKLNYSV